ncbi:MAG: MFS transporter [Anaerolineae bacterium]|nr:MFS transporter [Anaerolineae bacterium]
MRYHWRLPSLHEFAHDARQLILASGLITGSFLGLFSLLRSLYLLRLGFTPAYVGIYYAIGSFAFMAMGMPSGALGQRFGTRRIMLLSVWLTVAGMAILPVGEMVAPKLRTVIPVVSQLVLTVGWSSIAVNLVPALMAVTEPSNRSSAYAMSSALQGIGTLVGTVVGGALPGLIARVAGLTTADPAPYAIALLIGALLGLLAIGPLRKVRGGQRPTDGAHAALQRGPFPLLPVAAMVAYVFLRHAGWTTCQAFCGPYMDTELLLSTTTIGLVTGIGQVAAVLVVFAIPRLAERWHHGWIVATSTAILAISLLLLALVPHWIAVAVGLLGVQVASSLWLPALQVFQMELVPDAWRAIAYGALTTAMGSGFGVMSLFGGYFIDRQGYRPLFQLGVVLSVAGTLLMAGISARKLARSNPGGLQ